MELETIEHEDVVLFEGDPRQRMLQMTEVAAIIAEPVRQRHVVSISGRDHVRVEGWTMLGALLGVHPYLVWSRPISEDGFSSSGWEARVEARLRDGTVVGSAEAECLRAESNWRDRDDYALRSMAQTRATSKAMRQPLGFVLTLAGFDPTPAEEMPAFQAPSDRDLSEPQRKKLYALKAKLIRADEFDDDTFKRAIRAEYHVDQIDRLTASQANELIERLEQVERKVDHRE